MVSQTFTDSKPSLPALVRLIYLVWAQTTQHTKRDFLLRSAGNRSGPGEGDVIGGIRMKLMRFLSLPAL